MRQASDKCYNIDPLKHYQGIFRKKKMDTYGLFRIDEIRKHLSDAYPVHYSLK
jgi:hypothetical protein